MADGEIDADVQVEDEFDEVPEDVDEDWEPEGYEPGPDDPGNINDECGEDGES